MASLSMRPGARFRKPRSRDRNLGLDTRGCLGDTDRAVLGGVACLRRRSWPAMTASARGKLLYRLADLVARDAGLMAELETRDTGKVIRETRAVIAYVAEYYRYFAGMADKIEDRSCRSTSPISRSTPGASRWAWWPRSFPGTTSSSCRRQGRTGSCRRQHRRASRPPRTARRRCSISPG